MNPFTTLQYIFVWNPFCQSLPNFFPPTNRTQKRSCNLLRAATHSRRPAGTTRGRLGWAAGWASWLQPSRRSPTGTSRWLLHLQNSHRRGGFHPRRSRVCAEPSCTAWAPVPPGPRTSVFQKIKNEKQERKSRLLFLCQNKRAAFVAA